MQRFVKAANTEVPVSRSQAELERVLKRYGAFGFGFQADYEKHIVRVSFRVPDTPGSTTVVPIRLEVSIEAIAEAMYNLKDGRRPTQHGWEQSERVAWRHLVVWIDAACSASQAGLQKMSEAFLAHTLVKGDDGVVMRVIDQLNQRGEWRALLPAGDGR